MANLLDLFGRGLVSGEGMHHELARGTFKNALQHVPCQLPLGLLRRKACFIDVRPLRFVSPHGAFCGHNLEELQHRRVPERLLLAKRLVHFAHGSGAAGPQHTQYLKLRSSWFLRRTRHEVDVTTKAFVVSTKIFVDSYSQAPRTSKSRRDGLRMSTGELLQSFGLILGPGTSRLVCLTTARLEIPGDSQC